MSHCVLVCPKPRLEGSKTRQETSNSGFDEATAYLVARSYYHTVHSTVDANR